MWNAVSTTMQFVAKSPMIFCSKSERDNFLKKDIFPQRVPLDTLNAFSTNCLKNVDKNPKNFT